MDKKVHLSEMNRPYVGIRKNHTEEIKMDKKVHLDEMDLSQMIVSHRRVSSYDK